MDLVYRKFFQSIVIMTYSLVNIKKKEKRMQDISTIIYQIAQKLETELPETITIEVWQNRNPQLLQIHLPEGQSINIQEIEQLAVQVMTRKKTNEDVINHIKEQLNDVYQETVTLYTVLQLLNILDNDGEILQLRRKNQIFDSEYGNLTIREIKHKYDIYKTKITEICPRITRSGHIRYLLTIQE